MPKPLLGEDLQQRGHAVFTAAMRESQDDCNDAVIDLSTREAMMIGVIMGATSPHRTAVRFMVEFLRNGERTVSLDRVLGAFEEPFTS